MGGDSVVNLHIQDHADTEDIGKSCLKDGFKKLNIKVHYENSQNSIVLSKMEK
jgi:hypothetical protein